jgi:hypothetical protein
LLCPKVNTQISKRCWTIPDKTYGSIAMWFYIFGISMIHGQCSSWRVSILQHEISTPNSGPQPSTYKVWEVNVKFSASVRLSWSTSENSWHRTTSSSLRGCSPKTNVGPPIACKHMVYRTQQSTLSVIKRVRHFNIFCWVACWRERFGRSCFDPGLAARDQH